MCYSLAAFSINLHKFLSQYLLEFISMERPIFKPIGTPALELDTPALTVDVDKLDKNISTMAEFFETKSAKLRPHM